MTRDDDSIRYRKAARQALDQLDWCATYFRRIHKPRIAEQVARNRAAIARRLDDLSDGAHSQPRR